LLINQTAPQVIFVRVVHKLARAKHQQQQQHQQIGCDLSLKVCNGAHATNSARQCSEPVDNVAIAAF
jgi:hypothetical protein